MQTCTENKYGTVGINGLNTMFTSDVDLPGEYGTVGINGYKAPCLLAMQTYPRTVRTLRHREWRQ